MDGEVAVLGYLNYLEIWNHERFVGALKDKNSPTLTTNTWAIRNLICMYTHTPVLLEEVLRTSTRSRWTLIDATFGRVSHTSSAGKFDPDGRLLAIDQDESAIEQGQLDLQSFGSRLSSRRRTFEKSHRLPQLTDSRNRTEYSPTLACLP